MTGYPQRIEAARADVEALLKDAQELQRLHDERAGQLDELKASGSRDFARMTEIEGQRAALATMQADQAREVQQARGNLAALEREAARDVRLSRIGDIAAETAQIHAEVRAGLDALTATLEEELSRLYKLEGRWLALREAWMQEAYFLGQPVIRGSDLGKADALLAELRARGVDVDALMVARFGGMPLHETRTMPLVSAKPDASLFSAHLPVRVAGLYVNTWHLWLEANTREAAQKAAANE